MMICFVELYFMALFLYPVDDLCACKSIKEGIEGFIMSAEKIKDS